jgi:hypothetical protein
MSNSHWPSIRLPRRCTRTAVVLIGFLAIVVLVFVAGTLALWPSGWPAKGTDQWAALGTLYGAGAFVLALIATALAAIAYINSTEKPLLVLAQTSMPVGYQGWFFSLRLENRGPVAARFVAVKLKFNGTRIRLPYGGYPMEPKWTSGRPGGWDLATEAFWEGGADAVLHPRWPYQLPSFQCNLDPWSKHAEATLSVEVVADDVPSFVTRFRLAIE